MTIRVWNNDSTDYCDYTADTIEEIREMAKARLSAPSWKDGWNEEIESSKKTWEEE